MMQPSNPFKMYDIRGLYPEEINEDLARRVGQAYVVWLRGELKTDHISLVVGRDMRLSSPALHAAIMAGVEDVGGQVTDIGMVPTPVGFYATATGPFHGGIMVTASHNPSEYNAFKLCFHDGRELSGLWGFSEIEKLVQQDHEKRDHPRRREEDALSQYLFVIADTFRGAPENLTVILDYGNGVGALSAAPLFERLGIRAEHHYEKPDGLFPNHIANPVIPENIKDLQGFVRGHDGHAVGIAIDADGDRVRLVDEDGVAVDSDRLTCALAYYRYESFPKDQRRVFIDLRASRAATDRLKEVGIEVVPVPAGRVYYKPLMLDGGGICSGEISGHIIFADHFGVDDALLAGVRSLEMMNDANKLLKEIMKPFSEGWVRRQETNYERTTPFEELAQAFKGAFPDGEENRLDGLTLAWEDKWFNVRPSNTEPLVRVVVEAREEETLQNLVEHVEGVLGGQH